jgi:hypothetical protein
MTVRRAIRSVARAPLHLLVWFLAEPIIWIPLRALLLSRLGWFHPIPFAAL